MKRGHTGGNTGTRWMLKQRNVETVLAPPDGFSDAGGVMGGLQVRNVPLIIGSNRC